MEKRTTLYDSHLKYGGKMVPFAGFELPVEYKETGLMKEHLAVRNTCGMFDVSHMGEISCVGPKALETLNQLMTNEFSGMYDGQARYAVMCYEDGGCVDDMIVYKEKEDHYLVVANAANKEKDFAWMKKHEVEGATFTDLSDEYGQIALQGPKAKEILLKIVKEEDLPKKYYSAVFNADFNGMKFILSKTGYTGEDGYELYMNAGDAPKFWEDLMEAGKEEGLTPCGLGARDTLRLEAGMPLYGHEMDETITPLEAGLGFAVKLNKEFFNGKKAMEEKESDRTRVGLKVTGRGIVREHMDVFHNGEKVGVTTSGTHAPYLGYAIAMAYVPKELAEVGTAFEVDVRGRKVGVEVINLPFYKKSK